MRLRVLAPVAPLLLLAASAAAQLTPNSLRPRSDFRFEERDDGSILAADRHGTVEFAGWNAYVASPFFQRNGAHCGSSRLAHPLAFLPQSDCSSSSTNPAAIYDPVGGVEFVIPVVFHVIRRTDGTGQISDALLQTQIDVLNEDFQAYGGGAPGTNTRIRFTLAGVTRTTNNTWYDDSGSYYNTLAWDPTRYLNIYTNSASGYLGYAYVPSSGGVVGNLWDRVVCYWASVGRPGPIGSPYDLGRTATHEVGHYLGLYHTFDGGCAGTLGCYQNGDLICDTLPEDGPNFSPCTRSTCGDPDPTHNYMDYSDDVCMDQFTRDQALRMRCTLLNFRVDLPLELPGPATSPNPFPGQANIALSPTLSWNSGSGATSHTIYFGTNPSPGLGELQGSQATSSFAPGLLAAATTYYWRIDEVNSVGTTTGSVWSFTTQVPGEPPDPATLLFPRDRATNVGRIVDLSWTPGAGGVSHAVHFGTIDPPPFVQYQGETSFDPGALTRGQTYYWRIDEINIHGTTTGPVWSFTPGPNIDRR
jgi:hypothetical protein